MSAKLEDKPALIGGKPTRSKPFPRWPSFDQRESDQLEDVLKSGNWGGHPSPNRKARQLAERFAALQGSRFAIPTSSGTSALEVAFKALGLGPGDEVIVPALTFCATAYAAVVCGALPVFADVDPATACIDPAAVERLISPRTKAIAPVHYGSHVADLDRLTKLAERHSIAIVEDCAHVPGAQWRGRGVGTYGQLGCFSFQSSKPMTAGEGGMIVTSDPELEQRSQSLINCGRRRSQDTFDGPVLGANYRMTEWQCGILLAQLERLPQQAAHKAKLAQRLEAGLGQIRGIRVMREQNQVTRRIIYMLLFAIDECEPGISRGRFAQALQAEGIPCGSVNEPVYRSPLFPLDTPAYRNACQAAGRNPDATIVCEVAERLYEHELIALPHFMLLGDESDVEDIVEAVSKIVKHAAELAAQ